MAAPTVLDGSVEKMRAFVDAHDAFLLDLDGVVWHGGKLIAGVKDVLAYLRSLGKKLIFVTNNATKSRTEFKQTFDKLGLEVEMDEIFGSAYAAAVYLKYNLKFPSDKKIYVVGEKGIEDELASDDIRIQTCGGTNPADNVFVELMEFENILPDPDVGAVLCGFDMHMNYQKLARAHRYLLENPGCLFVLTNDDSTFPTLGTVFPGAGAISAPLRYALPSKKPIVIGKPNQPMLDCILAKHQLDRKKTCMIGDRLDTDIAFGLNGGTSTLAVLTGVIKMSDIDAEVAKKKEVNGDAGAEEQGGKKGVKRKRVDDGGGNDGNKDGEATVPDYVVGSLGDFAALIET